MKGKEALEKLLNHCIITTTSREQIKVLKIYNTIKAELDKLDRIKEVVEDCDWGNVLNYPHDKIIGINIIKQIIEEETNEINQ